MDYERTMRGLRGDYLLLCLFVVGHSLSELADRRRLFFTPGLTQFRLEEKVREKARKQKKKEKRRKKQEEEAVT